MKLRRGTPAGAGDSVDFSSRTALHVLQTARACGAFEA
jgi:hypothetical protein